MAVWEVMLVTLKKLNTMTSLLIAPNELLRHIDRVNDSSHFEDKENDAIL